MSFVRRAFLRRPVLSTTTLCLLLAAPFYGSRGLFESSEGRYAECARQMMESASFWTPILNGRPHLTKPPLTYWAIIAGLKTIGVTAWGVRAYLLVAHCLAAVFTVLLARELYGRRTAIMTGVVFSGAPYVLAGAQVVTTDLLVTAWIAMAMWAFWRGLRTGQHRYMTVMWLAIGLGMLTKGPVGLLPFFGGLLPVYVLTRCAHVEADRPGRPFGFVFRTVRDGLQKRCPSLLLPYGQLRAPALAPLAGLVLCAAVGGSWFATDHSGRAISEAGALFALYWFAHEVIGRIFLGEFHRNPEFTYALSVYLPLLCFGMGPWFLWALLEGRAFAGRVFATLRRWHWAADPRTLYLTMSLWGPGLIYFTARSKLPLYVLPLAIPLAILWGRYMADCLRRQRLSWNVVTALILVAIPGYAGVRAGLAHVPAQKNMETLATAVRLFERQPSTPLIVGVGRALNGLQFELRRELPVASWKEILEDAPTIGQAPPNVWLLMPGDFADRLAKAMGRPPEVVTLTPHWKAVAWPLEADEIVYWPANVPPPRGVRLHLLPRAPHLIGRRATPGGAHGLGADSSLNAAVLTSRPGHSRLGSALLGQ